LSWGGCARRESAWSDPPRCRPAPNSDPRLRSPVRRQPIPAGFHPDTSAAAFQPKSRFPFTLRVKPCQLQDAFHCPILSGSMDFQQFFNCGLQAHI
jgi:hypothetical protein